MTLDSFIRYFCLVIDIDYYHYQKIIIRGNIDYQNLLLISKAISLSITLSFTLNLKEEAFFFIFALFLFFLIFRFLCFNRF